MVWEGSWGLVKIPCSQRIIGGHESDGLRLSERGMGCTSPLGVHDLFGVRHHLCALLGRIKGHGVPPMISEAQCAEEAVSRQAPQGGPFSRQIKGDATPVFPHRNE